MWLLSLFLIIANAKDICSEASLPQKLSETCLYGDDGKINPELLYFKPIYTLWTDGADKMRWVYIPKGSKIDSSDMNNWKFPIGTKFFKQFAYDEKKIETRVFVKTKEENGISSWQMGPYIWNNEQTEATLTLAGASNALGTQHDVPNQRQCISCHMGSADSGLGFSAIQQGHIIELLIKKGLLSHIPTTSTEIVGNVVEKSALGYLHANCSHCHNPNGIANVINLYYEIGTPSVERSNAYLTTVNQKSVGSKYFRVSPGKPESSYLYQRISSRTPGIQMPPVGTEKIDQAGQSTLRDWINKM